MQITEKLTKKISEAKYLNADNADRYRCIMRIFYEHYEKIKYWLYQEEIYGEMLTHEYFKEYRAEQCQQDLAALLEWGNLTAMQDTHKAASIEEFKSKKFRYQMSEYSVEIERLVLRLENLSVEGASLEPTLLERIRQYLSRMEEMADRKPEEIYGWWNDLNNDFVRLNQNYQDYIRDLNSVKAEEMMMTKAFLIFKDKLIEYLRSFIKGLQNHVGTIEEMIRMTDEEKLARLLEKVSQYELSIPRMEMEVTFEQIAEKNQGRWESIREWFAGKRSAEGYQGDSEAGKLFDATNEIIRRITRYAARLSERSALGANRREEYRKVASLFLKCQDVSQAHEMSAMVFGLESPGHFQVEHSRKTDSMNGEVYEEQPFTYKLKPRIRSYREAASRSSMTNHAEEKNQMREKILEQHRLEAEKIAALEKDGQICFWELPILETQIREILLKWISDALEHPRYIGRTQDGRGYRLEVLPGEETCQMVCEDGILTMPKMSIVFTESDEDA
jgi:uncharacterized protein (TIGR02677 family)